MRTLDLKYKKNDGLKRGNAKIHDIASGRQLTVCMLNMPYIPLRLGYYDAVVCFSFAIGRHTDIYHFLVMKASKSPNFLVGDIKIIRKGQLFRVSTTRMWRSQFLENIFHRIVQKRQSS